MILIKLFAISAVATFSVAAPAQHYPYYPPAPAQKYELRFDATHETIRQIDFYVDSLSKLDGLAPDEYGHELLDLFAEAREVLTHWSRGEKLCLPEEAKSLAPLARKFAARHSITDKSARADELIRGWFANRMIECIDQYHEQHERELQLIESIANLGYQPIRHHSWLVDKPEAFWADYFFNLFDQSQNRSLKNKILLPVGSDCLGKQQLVKVFDEHITQQCTLLERMKEAEGYALKMYQAFTLVAVYPSNLRDLISAHDACQLVAKIGQDQVRELALKGY